tara:strand:+ start:39 stop:551 length:513 start_codon:yes stop_codon:yes gene_type:complete
MELSDEFVLELTQVQQRLYSYIYRRLANRDQAQEVLQQVNLVLCRKADDFELGTNFDAWAVTVAHYQILSYRKTQARDRLVFTDEVMNIVDDQQGDNTARERVLKQLRRCFQALSVDNRAFLILRYEGGLSMAQMAMEVSKTAGAVRVKLHRLRRGLRDCVQNHLRKEKA